MKYQALPGFRDFHPELMAARNHVFAAWRRVARAWGFEEYDGPPLEPLELYVEKSGEEIVGQLFNFTDKGGRDVAMRPEMTPTVVRMLGGKIKGMPLPARWFSTPQLFRYEKQQRGRLREHFQLNMDIVGEASILADADLLCAALAVLEELGFSSRDVVARVSDRRLLRSSLLHLGVREPDLATAYNIVDKVEREPRDHCLERLVGLGVSPSDADEILGLTDLSLDDLRERMSGNEDVAAVLTELDSYFDAVNRLGFGDWVVFDMKIVRGLAYYTGTVFEIFDRKGELRAICGGGRYDQLFELLTGIDMPALGFGFGDVVLTELLSDRGLLPELEPAAEVIVIGVDDTVRPEALEIVASLRGEGIATVYPYRSIGVGKALKKAATSGVRLAVIVGPDELAAGRVSVKTLSDGSERSVARADLAAAIART